MRVRIRNVMNTVTGKMDGRFGIDVLQKDPKASSVNIADEIGDYFYSKEEAFEYLMKRWPDMRPMRLPGNASSYRRGWPSLEPGREGEIEESKATSTR